MNTQVDTFYTLIPLNWILRVFSLSNVTRKDQLILCQSQFKNIATFTVLSMLIVLFIVFKINLFNNERITKIFKFSDSIQFTFIFGYIEYVVDFFLTYKLRYERLNYLLFYNNVDSVLGKPEFTKIRSVIKNIVTIFIICFVLVSVGDYFAWYSEYGWFLPSLYSVEYICYFTNTMTVLDVVSHLLQIEYRMKIVVKYIEDYYTSTLSLFEISNDIKINLNASKVSRLEQLRIVSSRNREILVLRKSYLLLVEQVYYINKAFGVRLLVFCGNYLISLIHTLNLIIRIIQGRFESDHLTNCFPLIFTVFRAAGYLAVIVLLVIRCEQVYKQCNAAIRLVDLILVDEKICPEIRKAFTELRVLIISRPIKFQAAGFFTCDYPLLVSITSAVGTYTIIMYENMQ